MFLYKRCCARSSTDQALLRRKGVSQCRLAAGTTNKTDSPLDMATIAK